MDQQSIITYKSTFDSIMHEITADDGSTMEVWYARELQSVCGYARWENFAVAINRAKESCKSQKISIEDHFRDVTKMVSLGSGVDDKGFGRIRSKGDAALFGGVTTEQMKKRLGVKSGALADHLPQVTIAAKNLATEMTNYNVEAKDLHGEPSITQEHVQNNRSVRQILGQRGIKPELLPPAEDIKKVERRVAKEEKALGESQKLPKKTDK